MKTVVDACVNPDCAWVSVQHDASKFVGQTICPNCRGETAEYDSVDEANLVIHRAQAVRAKVSSLVLVDKAKPVVDEELVGLIKDTLARIESGEVNGCVLVIQKKGGGAEYNCLGIEDRWKTLGFLSHTMHKLQTN